MFFITNNSTKSRDAYVKKLGGMGFDGSSITGFNAIEESDMIAMPDISTFKIIPWSPKDAPTARMICDVRTPEGDPYVGDPRYVLRRALERAHEMGFDNYYCGPELEFFYFKDSTAPEPLGAQNHTHNSPLAQPPWPPAPQNFNAAQPRKAPPCETPCKVDQQR